MSSRSIRILMSGLLVALAIGASPAGSAAATWTFSGSPLSGTEVTMGFGVKSSLTLPAPVTCEHFLYRMIISNTGGTEKSEVTELPLFNCTSSAKECTVEAIEAEELPWPSHLATVEGINYVVIENVGISILFGGESCPLNEVLATVTGSAGASFDNSLEAAVFSEASFTKTGTALSAFGSPVRLEGVFPTEAFQWHRGEPIGVS